MQTKPQLEPIEYLYRPLYRPANFATVPKGWDAITFAEDQKEYQSLPAAVSRDPTRTVMSEWIPTSEELELILNGGKIRVRQLTYFNMLQPIFVDVIE